MHQAPAQLLASLAEQLEILQTFLERDDEPRRLGRYVKKPCGFGWRQFHGGKYEQAASRLKSYARGRMQSLRYAMFSPLFPPRDATFINRNFRS